MSSGEREQQRGGKEERPGLTCGAGERQHARGGGRGGHGEVEVGGQLRRCAAVESGRIPSIQIERRQRGRRSTASGRASCEGEKGRGGVREGRRRRRLVAGNGVGERGAGRALCPDPDGEGERGVREGASGGVGRLGFGAWGVMGVADWAWGRPSWARVQGGFLFLFLLFSVFFLFIFFSVFIYL